MAQNNENQTPMFLGILGAIALMIGVFLPIMGIPIIGNLTYFQVAKQEGITVLIVALIGFILAVVQKYDGLWLTAMASACVVGYTFINSGLTKTTEISIQLGYGWAVLVVGVLLTFAAPATAIMNANQRVDTSRNSEQPSIITIISIGIVVVVILLWLAAYFTK